MSQFYSKDESGQYVKELLFPNREGPVFDALRSSPIKYYKPLLLGNSTEHYFPYDTVVFGRDIVIFLDIHIRKDRVYLVEARKRTRYEEEDLPLPKRRIMGRGDLANLLSDLVFGARKAGHWHIAFVLQIAHDNYTNQKEELVLHMTRKILHSSDTVVDINEKIEKLTGDKFLEKFNKQTHFHSAVLQNDIAVNINENRKVYFDGSQYKVSTHRKTKIILEVYM